MSAFAGEGILLLLYSSPLDDPGQEIAWNNTVEAVDPETGESLWTRTFKEGSAVVGQYLLGFEDGQAVFYR